MKLIASHRIRQPKQAGVALIFALLALVALTMGAVALIRSVDTGTLALGNLSFKQSGVTAGAKAADQALTWLAANIGNGTLDANIPAKGYSATSMDSLDPTGRSVGTANLMAQVDWDDNNCAQAGVGAGCMDTAPEITVGSDKVRYIITRLCSKPLPTSDATNSCAVPVAGSTIDAAGRGSLDAGAKTDRTGGIVYSPYFRIITRTVGPKGTVSFTETMVRF
ncbi:MULTISPECIES: hypothetical protein [unclassified Roseateles]|uniref:pilus assembly PilX family protein n=1 Tax=Roseateles TaxID=93681 RepID=UPI003095D79A